MLYELEATEGYVFILRSGVGIFVSWPTIILKQKKEKLTDFVKITKSHNILLIAF